MRSYIPSSSLHETGSRRYWERSVQGGPTWVIVGRWCVTVGLITEVPFSVLGELKTMRREVTKVPLKTVHDCSSLYLTRKVKPHQGSFCGSPFEDRFLSLFLRDHKLHRNFLSRFLALLLRHATQNVSGSHLQFSTIYSQLRFRQGIHWTCTDKGRDY